MLEDAVTECESAPPSDHEVNVFWVPADVCGEVVAMVWLEPSVQVRDCEAVYVVPSTEKDSPDGVVPTVTLTVAAVTVTVPVPLALL